MGTQTCDVCGCVHTTPLAVLESDMCFVWVRTLLIQLHLPDTAAQVGKVAQPQCQHICLSNKVISKLNMGWLHYEHPISLACELGLRSEGVHVRCSSPE